MSENDPSAGGQGGAPNRRAGLGRGLSAAIGVALTVGVGYGLYVILSSAVKPAEGDGLHALATGSMAKLQTPAQASSYPPAAFVDGEARAVRLADFRGKVVVLNLWATWCTPCVKEMPTLARLQARYAGRVAVVALSQDRAADSAPAKAFIARNPPLAFYQDPKTIVFPEIMPAVQGFPTTVIYDRGGAVRAVLAGEADWSSDEARAVVDHVLAE